MGLYEFRGRAVETHVTRVAKPHREGGRWTYTIIIRMDPSDETSGVEQKIEPRYFDSEQEAERAARMHGEDIVRDSYM